MFVYRLAPIDDWSGWHLATDLFRISDKPTPCYEYAPDGFDPNLWPKAWIEAQRLARRIWWEGDIREGPYVCPMPSRDDSACDFLIAWKQDNNGTTFVASPWILPHLADPDEKNVACSADLSSAKVKVLK